MRGIQVGNCNRTRGPLPAQRWSLCAWLPPGHTVDDWGTSGCIFFLRTA